MKSLMLGALLVAATANASELPPLKLDLSYTTVSGLSSGGYMANQFHIAHSDWVKGAGIIAAGPYYCAEGSLSTALGACINKRSKNTSLEEAASYLAEQQKHGNIADLKGLKNSKVWIFSGSKDSKVITPVTDALATQYQGWLSEGNVRYIKDKPFAHHFPTRNKGSACEQSVAPFLGNCHYDAAGEMLQFILPAAKPATGEAKGNIYSVLQPGSGSSSLAEEGYVYVPEPCASGQSCRLHISFHGCNQSAQNKDVGMQYVQNTGLNRWADANQLVVLYPQTVSSMLMPFNPQGCWDWWGYTDEHYATRKGAQIKSVAQMANNLAGK